MAHGRVQGCYSSILTPSTYPHHLTFFHPLFVIFDEALLLGTSKEPKGFLTLTVIVVAQCFEEVGTLHDMIRLKAQNVLDHLAEIVRIEVMLTVMVAVYTY